MFLFARVLYLTKPFIFAGELLKLAADLLREGLHTAEILEGYQAAYLKVQGILPSLVCHTVKDVRSKDQLAFAIKAVIGSKQYGFEVQYCLTIASLQPQELGRKISMTWVPENHGHPRSLIFRNF